MQDKYIENSYIEFQTELVRFLDMDEAKEIYLNASFIYEASPSADDDDIDDFFSILQRAPMDRKATMRLI